MDPGKAVAGREWGMEKHSEVRTLVALKMPREFEKHAARR
jgi:hypothetical protein